MALVLGTNCGFVTVAPIVDPGGGGNKIIDATSWALKHTTPTVLTKITQVGWWCASVSEESNFEVGLYSHNAGTNKPDTRLYVVNTNAKGTATGWKTVTVDWTIVPETIYWIAVQLDNTTTTTYTNYTSGSGARSLGTSTTTLTDPWAGGAAAAEILAFYAKCSAGVTEYDEGTKTVTGGGAVSLTVESVVWVEGVLVVTGTLTTLLGTEFYQGILIVIGALTVLLKTESYQDRSGWPFARASDYDPDLYWDEATEVWVTTRKTGPGNLVDFVVVVGEEGEVYFGKF
jgi:hypothetical protein